MGPSLPLSFAGGAGGEGSFTPEAGRWYTAEGEVLSPEVD